MMETEFDADAPISTEELREAAFLGFHGKKLIAALRDLDCSEILGVAESCASGTPRWEFVHRRIEAARAILAKAPPP